jgi:hypothetical protein
MINEGDFYFFDCIIIKIINKVMMGIKKEKKKMGSASF